MEKSNISTNSSIKSFMANILLLLILFFNVNSLEETKNLYLHKDNDLLLFLTKDGYLNSYQKKGNNILKKNLKICLGNNIFNPNEQITNDISISMINDKLYVIKNNEIIPFSAFVTDLENNEDCLNNDNIGFIIKSNIKYSDLVIDSNEEKILKELNQEKNNIEKKVSGNNKLIKLKKVEYILEKIDKNATNNILMNITINDIYIMNNATNYILLEEKDLDKFIKDMTINININKTEIISIYKYSEKDKKISLLYNKDLFNKNYSKEKQPKEKEIKELIQENYHSEFIYYFNNNHA